LTTQFDIERLKSIKLVPQHGRFPITRIKRNDLIDKFSREAIRVLDRGRRLGGIEGRQTQSTHFTKDEDEWVKSFVLLRMKDLPKKQNKDKMEKKIRYLLNQNNPESQWEAIMLTEMRYRTDGEHHHAGTLATIEILASDYWKMVGLSAA
jgi:ubiquinone/menaquinone biosynthesis C-methylase UbiE